MSLCHKRDLSLIGACATVGMLVVGCGDTPLAPVAVPPEGGLRGFAAQLDSIRVELRIPGMAAAIAQEDEIVWSGGFGLADVESGREATDTTSFYVASVTKPIAAIALMQLVEQGLLDLDDPISQYGVKLEAEGVVTVRNVLNHTSDGTPGSIHRYNNARYAELGDVMLRASGLSFAQLPAERIIHPLGLRHTAPDPSLLADFYAADLNRQAFIANLAMPYELIGSQVTPSGVARHFSPAMGLASSVRDLAAISIALDQDRFLARATKELMLSPSIDIDGPERAYGLGWHVQTHQGVKLEWHHGWANAHSALILRAPGHRLTFVAVANTSRMSGAYNMSIGDVMQSGPGSLFVNEFVMGEKPPPAQRRATSHR